MTFENKDYFSRHKYRKPEDYAVKSYVTPKIDFIAKTICLKNPSIKILDVGSGNGTFSFYFKEYTNNITCVDYSYNLLKNNPVNFKVLASAYDLPIRDGYFDIVFEANLLHHLDHPEEAIEEMLRCSSKYLIFIEPNKYNPLMYLFGLLVPSEKGMLFSDIKKWRTIIKSQNISIISSSITGMVSQQNTPSFMVPLLKFFDFNFLFGEYIILVCKKDEVKNEK
ncbi:MAG: class I SAM-dependent methyltransferase [Candidatus Omnitrophica bacterium]|nr:class I SAM-dependent methyltransferase [Candidatus Omnitrophota bacterium]